MKTMPTFVTVALSDKLQKSQIYCFRFVFDLKRDDHITPYFIRSNILKLPDLKHVKILTILFSMLKSGEPKYFSETFEFVSQAGVRNTRSGSSLLRMPQHRSAVYDKSFTVTACRLWNSLSDEIKSIQSRPRFVGALKNLYFEQMSAVGS